MQNVPNARLPVMPSSCCIGNVGEGSDNDGGAGGRVGGCVGGEGKHGGGAGGGGLGIGASGG